MDRQLTLTPAEERLAALIWQEAPLTSPELVSLAQREMDWKKSTTYTVLKKLCEKGIFQNEQAHVRVLLTREALIEQQSRHFVEASFGGSLPKFLASFIGGKTISPEQADELRRLIDEHEGS